MDNHLHVLLRLDQEVADGWSDEEVVRHWGRLFPPRDQSRQALAVTDNWVQWRLKDSQWVATARQRLQSISWFMKSLKEPLSRLANRQDKVRGAFFEARFKSVAILDDEALLAIAAYIDLNPVAAGIAEVPETSAHTSIKVRSEHVDVQGRTAELEAAADGSVAGSCASAGLEESLWLCPIEDRRRLDSCREGMLEGFSLDSYFLPGRLHGAALSQGKGSDLGGAGRSLDRLGSNAESGGPGWTNCAVVDCSAVSSPPVENGCVKSPHGWTCDAWQTWLAVRRDNANLNFGRHRQRNHSLPPFISHPQATGAVRPLIAR